jgi:hypothetical protein
MKKARDHTPATERHRARIEKRLSDLLQQTGSEATLDDLKAIIFNDDGERPFAEYVMYLTELFGAGGQVHIDALIPAIQDAWNFFPHRRLAGRCPAQLFLEQAPWLTPDDLCA